MWKILKGTTFFLLATSFSLLLSGAQQAPTQVGATIDPSISITITGGRNSTGKTTILVNDQIDFGNVSFISPENISNGDAFREKDVLTLEAILDVAADFNGADSVALELSKLKASSNPFAQARYSLSKDRGAQAEVIFEHPRSNRIARFTSSDHLTLRMLFDIKPNQSGKIFDQFQLEVTPQ